MGEGSHDSKPTLSERGTAEAAERQHRRADLLRQNLLKRKAQRRGRAGDTDGPGSGSKKGAAG